MLPLRYPRVWIGLGWLLLAGVCGGTLLPMSPVATGPAYDKLLHFGSYLVLMLWFGGLYGSARNYLVIAVVLIGLGLGLDLLQNLTETRQFDLLDVLANAGGVFVGFIALLAVLGGWCRTVERWLGD